MKSKAILFPSSSQKHLFPESDAPHSRLGLTLGPVRSETAAAAAAATLPVRPAAAAAAAERHLRRGGRGRPHRLLRGRGAGGRQPLRHQDKILREV